eukprot:gene21180-23254_t
MEISNNGVALDKVNMGHTWKSLFRLISSEEAEEKNLANNHGRQIQRIKVEEFLPDQDSH